MEKIKYNYKKDVIVNTIAQIFYLFALWVMTILTPRLAGDMGSEAAGIFTIALSVSNICTAIATYSINFYVASDIKHQFKDQHYLCFGLTSAFISLIVAFVVSLAFGYQNNMAMFWAVILYYVFKCAENITLIITASMQRAGKLYISGYALIVKAIISLGIFAITLYLSHNIVLSFGLIAIFAFIYLLLVDFTLLRKFTSGSYKFSKEVYKVALRLFVVALPLFIYGVTFATIVSFPRMVLGQYVDNTVVGYFGTMAAISTLIQSGVSALLIPFLPKLAKSYIEHDKQSLLKLIGIFTALIIVVTGLACLCAVFLDKWLLGILYPSDPTALEYAHYFKWIILATGVQALVIVGCLTLISFRKTWHVGIISLIGLITMFASSYPLIARFDITGVIVVYVLGYGIIAIASFIYIMLSIFKNNQIQVK